MKLLTMALRAGRHPEIRDLAKQRLVQVMMGLRPDKQSNTPKRQGFLNGVNHQLGNNGNIYAGMSPEEANAFQEEMIRNEMSSGAPMGTGGLFDPSSSKVDMQSVQDAHAMAGPLTQMSDEQRAQAWPKVVQALERGNPKLKGQFDPNVPPSQQVLQQFTSGQLGKPVEMMNGQPMDPALVAGERGPDDLSGHPMDTVQPEVAAPTRGPYDYNAKVDADQQAGLGNVPQYKGIRKRMAPGYIPAPEMGINLDDEIKPEDADKESKAADKESTDNMPLTASSRNQLQKSLIDNQATLETLDDVLKNWDSSHFTLSGQAYKKYLEVKGFALGEESLSEEDKKYSDGYNRNFENIKSIMLLWRKNITGVAGGEKEMKDIESTIINMRKSPQDAESSFNRLYGKLMRDVIVQRRLLQKGIVPEAKEDEAYTKKFKKGRQTVSAHIEDWVARAKKANPKIPKMKLYQKYMELGKYKDIK